jgi:hypothetical protein
MLEAKQYSINSLFQETTISQKLQHEDLKSCVYVFDLQLLLL